MIWPEIRKAYPDQWLIIEALEAHTEGIQRILDHIAVVETCADGSAAMESYERLHQEHPKREFYFVHTGCETLDIRERRVSNQLRIVKLSGLLKGVDVSPQTLAAARQEMWRKL